jgi:CelD/BcsL family acetyltransferase involved in cellulose biosynthesis
MDAVAKDEQDRAAAQLQVECVTSRAALNALRPEWDRLWATVPDRTPFQSSAWTFPWWDVFGSGELRVLAFRHGEQLVALVPLYLSFSDDGSRELRLIGDGISDYLDVLVSPPVSKPVLTGLAEILGTGLDEWTFCGLDHLRRGSLLVQLDVPPGTSVSSGQEEPCPALHLPSSPERLRDHIGASFFKNIRSQRRAAERMGGTAVHAATVDNVDSMIEEMFRLHDARWSCRGAAGARLDPAVREFHRAAAPVLLAAGLLRMYALRIGRQIAAIYYGLHSGDRAYYYLGGFDPAFSCVGPGTLVIAAAIEAAIEEGATTFDFLGGREAYKYRWGAVDEPRVSRYFRRAGCRAEV